ncbi:MAG: hypothetical protein ACI9K5_004120 [Gammaproteobacteria bacterium]|jgi:hypothetical protein
MNSTTDLPRDFRVSLLTPGGPAGVAVIELRGSDLSAALQRVGIAPPEVGRFALVHLHAGGERLDEALCCARAKDRVELHVHGSVPLVQEILSILGGPSREVELSLNEACWQAMAQAPSEVGARIALAQSQGLLRDALRGLEDLDEGEFFTTLANLEARGERARRWLEPTRIALQGAPNAGKSTLFNALVGFARVVTSGEAGTTRDPVMESTCLAGWPVELVDTAGLREVEPGSLEGRGQSLGQRLAGSAQVIFHLLPFGSTDAIPEGTHALVTHGDRPGAPRDAIDALHEPLIAAESVGRRLGEILDPGADPGSEWLFTWAAPCNAEQRKLLSQAASMESVHAAQELLRGALSRGL